LTSTVLLRWCYSSVTSVLHQCHSAVTLVLQYLLLHADQLAAHLQRCHSVITVVLRWCYGGVTVVSKCCYICVTVPFHSGTSALRWCYSGVTSVLQYLLAPGPLCLHLLLGSLHALWCYSVVYSVVYSGVTVVLQRLYSGVTVPALARATRKGRCQQKVEHIVCGWLWLGASESVGVQATPSS
jgi:hypothetical protein